MYPSKETPFFGTFVENFKEQLEDEGASIDLAVIRGKGNSKLDKIKKYFYFFKSVINKIQKDDYDLIYVHYIGHSLLPLFFVKFLIKKPLVLNAHGSDVFVNGKISLFIQKLVIPIIKKADMIVVPSYYFQDVVSTKFDILRDKIFISPSGGIDTKLFKPFDHKIKNDIFTIGYVSRIDIGKGWDILLDSIYILKNKNLKFRVVMVGSGSQNQIMIQKIKELKLEDIVEYVGGKPHNELPNYFNEMDLFIFPTTRNAESLGLVGIEAMACGLPVIGSNIGGLPSYIEDNVNGRLFEVGNIEELVKNIEYFINLNDGELKVYRNNAWEKAQSYDSKRVAKNLYHRLKEVSGEK